MHGSWENYANPYHLQLPDVPLRGAQVPFQKTAWCQTSIIGVKMTVPTIREGRTTTIHVFSLPSYTNLEMCLAHKCGCSVHLLFCCKIAIEFEISLSIHVVGVVPSCWLPYISWLAWFIMLRELAGGVSADGARHRVSLIIAWFGMLPRTLSQVWFLKINLFIWTNWQVLHACSYVMKDMPSI